MRYVVCWLTQDRSFHHKIIHSRDEAISEAGRLVSQGLIMDVSDDNGTILMTDGCRLADLDRFGWEGLKAVLSAPAPADD